MFHVIYMKSLNISLEDKSTINRTRTYDEPLAPRKSVLDENSVKMYKIYRCNQILG